MNLLLSEEQLLIQDSARKFLSRHCSEDYVREVLKGTAETNQMLWQEMADLGWMGLIIPERFGGIGAGFKELTILLEEMGRVCLPGPFFATSVLGTLCLMEIANEQQQEKYLSLIAAGEIKLSVALQEMGSEFNEASIQLKAESTTGGYKLQGVKLFVANVIESDYIICSGRVLDRGCTDTGITMFILPTCSEGITVTSLDSIGGSSLCEVVFNGVEVSHENVLGEVGQGWPYLAMALHKAAAAKAAEMVGGGQAVLDMVVAFAEERKQFGQVIGSFQAIQHHCVNMLVDLESARWMVFQCAWHIDNDELSTEWAAYAKSWCNQAYRRIIQLGHQVMGGIGYCEEHALPLYFRHMRMAEVMLGDSNTHRETIADALLGGLSSSDTKSENDLPVRSVKEWGNERIAF